MTEFFYDTYALNEYLNANKNFLPYFQKYTGITTKLNLMEMYYSVIRDENEEKAELAYDSFLALAVEIDDETIKKAMRLRLKIKKQGKNVSFVDAIGYQIAIDNGIKFLTGDKSFKEMENVEFVK